MSLRARLALLYTFLVGGILLVFGVTVYGYVSFTLIERVDTILETTANEIIRNLRVNTEGGLNVLTSPNLDLPADVYYQAWDSAGQLRVSQPQGFFTGPLDRDAMGSRLPMYRNVTTRDVPLRVLTIPVQVGVRPVGMLQVAANMTVVNATQRTLQTILGVGILMALSLAAFAGWFSTNLALAPLDAVTNTALQITRADDLSRRIPYEGPAEDEIGQLITSFNQTLSRLENLFHTQRRFMADVGHELRTPLTVIKGNVGLMRRIGADEESLASIESEVDRLTRMVGDLLLLAQAESGKLPLDRRLVELDTLLLEAMQQMRVLARDRLALRIGEIDQVLVCGDRDRLKQVIVNLIGNAINYTPAGGEVVVSASKSGTQARLLVSDSGPGIPEADLPYIFERFYRGEKSRTRSKDGKGFGLGLSIAYWIVRNHQGHIDVDSKEGKGTSFCIWLPLAEEGCGQAEE